MTDKEKIRAEIERIQESHERNLNKLMERGRIGYAHGCVDCCDIILSFIDSLPEAPSCPKESDDLEEAAEEYALNVNAGPYNSIGKYGFMAGAIWQKTQMMKEAVEGYVNYYEDSGGILMAEAQVGCPYHNGDKVKIIILKDDNERTPHNLD